MSGDLSLNTVSGSVVLDTAGIADEMSMHSDHDDPRVRARAQLQDAEAALAEFRASLRADLRLEVAHRGRQDPAVVELLATRLREVKREVVAALRG